MDTHFMQTAAVIVASLFVLQWLWKHVFKPRQAQQALRQKLNKPVIQKGLQILEDLFRGVNAQQVSTQARKQLGANSNAFVYGEIHYLSFAEILEIANPQKGDVFYDLGSGSGRAVFSAALLHEFSSVHGIELLSPLYQLSCHLLNKLNHMSAAQKFFKERSTTINFINNDILAIDIQDANVVFINATAFFGKLWERIVHKLDQLSSGTKIIVTSRQLEGSRYQLIDYNHRLMSWGMNSVYIYEKR